MIPKIKKKIKVTQNNFLEKMNQNSFSEFAWDIFNKSINDYHITDNVDANEPNNYAQGSLEQIL